MGGVHHRPSGMEIPGGVGGLKLNHHPWGDMDIFWKHTIEIVAIEKDQQK